VRYQHPYLGVLTSHFDFVNLWYANNAIIRSKIIVDDRGCGGGPMPVGRNSGKLFIKIGVLCWPWHCCPDKVELQAGTDL
jgi:hypothetical protein